MHSISIRLTAAIDAAVKGADPRLTGAPGDTACTSCRVGTALNGGSGSVRIVGPGVTQHVQASFLPTIAATTRVTIKGSDDIVNTSLGPVDVKVTTNGQPYAPAFLAATHRGIATKVSFAGLIPGYAGLYQFNVEVPAAAGDGDQPVVAQIGGASSPAGSDCGFLTVQR